VPGAPTIQYTTHHPAACRAFTLRVGTQQLCVCSSAWVPSNKPGQELGQTSRCARHHLVHIHGMHVWHKKPWTRTTVPGMPATHPHRSAANYKHCPAHRWTMGGT
jgi:hypothetical protein